ncbi:ComEC/Rec2 family competence protein [Flavobacterium sp. TAB 87]|uniref:ComEC/Rec2 family competence protein n=1 Tax=Flavobacterium sp. TAB 87 TaxID=1729581 RepID=UPI0018D266F5|nr:ComEC/Rec2 family competence protein [Flavobacterium sp. TAB 87]
MFLLTVILAFLNYLHKLTILFGVLTCFTAFSAGSVVYNLQTQSKQQTNYTNYLKAFKEAVYLQVVIREKLKSNSFHHRYIGTIQSIDNKNYTGKIILNVKKDVSDKQFKTGLLVATKEKLVPIATPKNPFQFNYAQYLNTKQIYAQVYCSPSSVLNSNSYRKDIWYYCDKIRSRIIENLKVNGLNNDELNVAIALLLGQRQDINAETITNYQFAGATHLLAVSGLHVGFVLLFINFFLSRIPNSKRNNFAKLLLTLVCLSFYAILTGLSPSIVRATLMFSAFAISDYLKRPSNTYHTLLLSAFLILLFDSNSLFDVGFQLSYSAVFFIVWMQPLFKKYRPQHYFFSKVYDLLTVSLAAQLGTLPLCLYYFHQFPGLFFITNLVVIPLVSIIMYVGIITIILALIGIPSFLPCKILHYLIIYLNKFIAQIASFKHFVIQDISFSSILMLSAFLLIVTFVFYLKKANYPHLIVMGIALVSLQLVLIYEKIKTESESEMIVFNSPKKTIMSLKKGNQITIFQSLNKTETSNRDWDTKPYLTKNTAKITIKQMPNFLFFNNHKIQIIDSSSFFIDTIASDIVVLRESPKVNLERLLKATSAKLVIADASNSKYIVDSWRQTCAAKKIPFHTTYEMGYYNIH